MRPEYYRNKKGKFIQKGLLSAVVLLALVFSSCDFSPYWGALLKGNLRVSVSSGAVYGLRSLLPGLSMDPEEYLIRGSGPDGESFEVTMQGEETDVEDLSIGEWCINVTAFNAEGLEIGYGESYAEVTMGKRTTVSVTVVPLNGTGSLSFSVVWPEEAGEDVDLEAVLTPVGGESEALVLEEGSCEASYSAAGLPAGYYTLNLQLLEGEAVLAGVADTIRIVADASTKGSYNFNDLNEPTGDVEIIVTVDLDDPLEVALSGAQDVLDYGTTMDVQALVSNAGGTELVYTWYLNGSSVGTEEILIVGSSLRRGFYRLDAVVFTADGLRSGSATGSFTVE